VRGRGRLGRPVGATGIRAFCCLWRAAAFPWFAIFCACGQRVLCKSGDARTAATLYTYHPRRIAGRRSCSRASDFASVPATVVVVPQAGLGLRARLAEELALPCWTGARAADVTDARGHGGDGTRQLVDEVVVVQPARSVVEAARDETRRDGKTGAVPAALRADGSMVPAGSMMPLPMPPFDMVWTGCACTEYIPGGVRAAGLVDAACFCRDEAQQRANGRSARPRMMRLAEGWCGGRSIRWESVVAKGRCRCGCVAATVARCKYPKFQRVGPSNKQAQDRHAQAQAGGCRRRRRCRRQEHPVCS
jgi:hypothetical protein